MQSLKHATCHPVVAALIAADSSMNCCIFDKSCLPYSFGTGIQRPKFGKSGCPGPGAYRLKPDLGKQFDSSKHSSSNAVFPIATKACTEKVGIKPAMALLHV